MGFSLDVGVPVLTVFLQGILSFFSPCVLPLLPVYISYFAGGAKTVDENNTIRYPRGKIFLHTLFFVLGISVTFFLLGFGFTTLGQFFSDNRLWFARISGIIMLLFGLYQLGVFGQSKRMEQERRLPFRLDRWTMGPIPAFLLGFTFSFAWTPCIGPTMGSVLLLAGSSETSTTGFLLIGVYTLGFVIPFLAVGLFTATVLNFFKKHQNIVRYTVKIGAVLLILMGVITFTGFMNGITGYLSGLGNGSVGTTSSATAESSEEANSSAMEEESSTPEPIAAPDFTLTDQYRNTHTLSDYKGKTVFLNFWATWCPPCRAEMPDIEKLYEKYGNNEEDLIVLGVAGPNQGNEGSQQDIEAFLEENNFTFPVVMDESGGVFANYGIRAFPTTFMIGADGNLIGYVESALTGEIMESIVKQSMEQQ